MARIFLCKTVNFVKKICYNCGDIDFFSKGLFLAHPVYYPGVPCVCGIIVYRLYSGL